MTKKKQGIIILILTAIFFLIYGFWRGYSLYNEGKHLNDNLGYAIGVYGGLTPKGGNIRGGPTGGNIFFSYIIDNELIKNIETLAIKSQNEVGIIAHKYLVVYDTTNLEHAAILFDYPIKDSMMFIKYKKDFSGKPLNLTPYFRAPIVFYLKDYSNK